jgi:hypothetical protein
MAWTLVFAAWGSASGQTTLRVKTPMPPPEWALLERELLRANSAACQQFYDRYFDDRGYLECVERWGGDDGPDDAIENLNDWPLVYALGGDEAVWRLIRQAWEGHLRQYSDARTTQVELARDGMYYKEFPTMFDWLHNGEGLTVFNLMGLCDPYHDRFEQRVRRFAGFYMNEDPGAANYDPKHKIIRSFFNGSRGPLLRKATALDWAGDPIEIANRFDPGHGERSYEEMLAHFRDYTDTIGDHPQNLLATSLALNAYLLTGEAKYRQWLLEYVDAWRERTIANGGIIPTNIGLDGKIGSACGGRWYGGVYGWGFSVINPVNGQVVHRNTHHFGLNGFGNALLLTGDEKYIDVWRRQIDAVNANAKTIDGKRLFPHMYGDDGWYDFRPEPYAQGALEIYYWSMDSADLAQLPGENWAGFHNYGPRKLRSFPADWIRFLQGSEKGYPERALRRDLVQIRERMANMAADTSTPDTRLADDPMDKNPATIASLVHLMLGGLHPGNRGSVLHSRLRYFDPIERRAGIARDVAALVERMTDDQTTVTLVNVNQIEPRTVRVQAGAYAEHHCQWVSQNDQKTMVNGSDFQVELAPGCGTRLVIAMRRYANSPTMRQPWDPLRSDVRAKEGS